MAQRPVGLGVYGAGSGSGSTVFAVLHEKPAGFPLGERLAEHFGTNLWCYLCETV